MQECLLWLLAYPDQCRCLNQKRSALMIKSQNLRSSFSSQQAGITKLILESVKIVTHAVNKTKILGEVITHDSLKGSPWLG